jgi:hypothetical protein
MEEDFNIMEPIQTLMDNVKKDIFLKTANKENKSNNKEIINSLFKLLDYQITLINQILLFNQNSQDLNANKNNIDNLIKINKDILVSMINKFLSSINKVFNKEKDIDNSIYNINKRIQTTSKKAKIPKLLSIQTTTNEKPKNFLLTNSYANYHSPIKKNMEKEFNSNITFTQQSSAKKMLTAFFEPDKNSYKYLKNRNIMYSIKNKKNYDIFDKLHNDDSKCDHEEKKRHKMLMYQAYSRSMKDLFVDLNDKYKNLLKK